MKRLLSLVFFIFLVMTVFTPCPAESAVDREKEVRDAVTAFVMNRSSGMGWEVRLRRITISDALKLPEGAIDYEIIAPQQWEGWGNINIAVIARQKERVVRNIPVRIDVEALADTVVTLRQIDNGSTIQAADITLQKREISYNSRTSAKAVTDVIGKKARISIGANQPVRTDQIEKVPVIKSGQMVTIIAENEVLKISVSGIAHSSGAVGDVVRVQNLTSLKEIPARVVDASTVQVGF
ncbi:MAG: flagellar basal body P-ring formation chaperone FlgA [Desulfuromonadaceae bacterium]|nr:flagellar basal body P-ring formation chaperone FlgA [Desulfuromonadaceae bacterium]